MSEAPEFWFKEYHSNNTGLFFRVSKVLHFEKTPYQRIDILETPDFGRILLLDGRVMTTERDEFVYHEMLVHPAMVLHSEPRKALVIGGGDGGALREILRYPVERAVLVELDARVVESAKRFFPNLALSFQDPRVEVLFGDGAQYVETSKERFDLLFVDSPDPIGPATTLFETSFYRNAKERLLPGGFFVAQTESPIHHLPWIQKIQKMLRDLYREVHFYLASIPTYPGGLWSFVLASDEKAEERRKDSPPGLKYYNHEIHRAAFSLPTFFREALTHGDRSP